MENWTLRARAAECGIGGYAIRVLEFAVAVVSGALAGHSGAARFAHADDLARMASRLQGPGPANTR